MPDYYFLTSPQGSVYNLGSWLRADPGPDFGSGAVNAAYAENPAAEGGVLAFETIGVRKMAFPLLLASHSAWTGLMPLESMLRLAARPGGAVLDLLPDGTPTAEAVRFDVLTGRLRMEYDVRMHGQLRKHNVTLELDTQPFGYWPTMIILASAASVGLPGVLSIAGGGSIFGDVPGLAEIVLTPTAASQYPPGNWPVDSLAWSISARPSFNALSGGGSVLNALGPGAVIGDKFAIGSQAQRIWVSGTTAATQWQFVFYNAIPTPLEPAYRGRYRVSAWLSLTPSVGAPVFFSADVGAIDITGEALASAAPIATLPPAVASGTPGAWGAQASPGYTLLDLGEISLPRVASGASQPRLGVRLWYGQGTSNIGLGASVQLTCAGIHLLPLDTAGFLPRGLARPTIANVADFGSRKLVLDAVTNRTFVTNTAGDPDVDAAAFYRGIMPRVGASSIQVDLIGAGRKANASSNDPPIYSGPDFATASLRYRPRFAFLKGI